MASDEQKTISLLAISLLGHAEQTESIERHDDGAWIHAASCPGYCDYACGAMWIGYTTNADGDITITEVQNSGTLRITVPEWP